MLNPLDVLWIIFRLQSGRVQQLNFPAVILSDHDRTLQPNHRPQLVLPAYLCLIPVADPSHVPHLPRSNLIEKV